jgi:hypothetical protein
VAWCSAAALFYHGDHGRGTDPQHPGAIANATPSERQVDHLAAALGDPAAILGWEEKDPPRTSAVLTLIALGPGGLLALMTAVR